MKFKKLAFLLLSITFCLSCQETKKEDLDQLNGYWEIKKVKQKNGKETVFKFNETVDFIEFENNQGIRTKVKPSLQGDFKATKDAESFTITKENDQWIFHYKTAMDEWQETLLRLDEDEFQVQNDREIIYTYQRFNGYLDGTK